MSRVRTRPTREDTCARLFAAAAEMFEAQGIGDTRIEDIAETAGFSRGAFYSNFADKDELIIAMLEDHAERSLAYHRAMLAQHNDPSTLLAVLQSAERKDDPLAQAPLLHIELVLYVARAEKRKPELAKRLRARRKLIAEVVTAVNASAKTKARVDPVWAASLLAALEDGYRLHRLIDPSTTPADSFFDSVARLRRLAGI